MVRGFFTCSILLNNNQQIKTESYKDKQEIGDKELKKKNIESTNEMITELTDYIDNVSSGQKPVFFCSYV